MKEQILKLKKSQLFADKLTLLFAIAALIFTTMFATVYAADNEEKKESPLKGINFTVANLSELCSDAYCSMIVESGFDLEEVLSEIDNNSLVGTIANGLGPTTSNSTSADKTTGNAEQGVDNASINYTLSGVLGNYISANTTSNSIDNAALREDVKNSTLVQYMLLGMGMQELGIDEIRTADGDLNTSFRRITGYITYILYIAAYTAKDIITKVLELLMSFNMFGILLGDDYVSDTIKATDIYKNLSTTPLIQDLRGWYNNIAGDLRFVVLGFMFIFLVASITVFKSKQMNNAAATQRRVRNFVYRIIIMFIGLPLAGMVYSEALSLISKDVEKNEQILDDYIYCQFIDMEGYFTSNYPFSFLVFEIRYTGVDGITVYEYGGEKEYDPVLFGYRINYINNELYDRQLHLPESSDNGGSGGIITRVPLDKCNSPTVKPRSKINLLDDSHAVAKEAAAEQKAKDENKEYIPGYIHTFEQGTYSNYGGTHKKSAFEFCRKLILSYAQCKTIVPIDVVKTHFANDKQTLLLNVNKAIDEASDHENYSMAVSDICKKLLNDESVSDIWSKVKNYDGTEDYKYTYEIIKDKIYLQHFSTAMFINVVSTGTGSDYNVSEKSGLFLSDTKAGDKCITELSLKANYDYDCAIFTNTLGNKSKTNNTENKINDDGTTINMYRYAYAFAEKDYDFIVPAGPASGGDSLNNVALKYTYFMGRHGLSPLSMYNYLNSVFIDDTLRIQNPTKTTNAGVAIQHYSTTLPYYGVNEIIYLAYTMSFLLALAVIGWVFGISLLMNCVVQAIKLIPTLFKMMVGSLTGFVEACVIGLSIVIEIIVTITFYTISLNIIDFMVKVIQLISSTITNLITNDESLTHMIENAAGVVVILWTIFQLIRWRQAIIITLKSFITHTFNQVFGTNAKMSTGANGGMLGLAAAGAAAAVGLHALAGEDGGLAGVVDDLAGAGDGALADTLTGMKDDLANGDFDGAKDKFDEAKSMMRGANSDDIAAKGLGEDGLDTNNLNDALLTDEQQSEVDNLLNQNKIAEAMDLQSQYQEQNLADLAASEGKEGAKGRGASAQKYDENMLSKEQNEAVEAERDENGDEAADKLADEFRQENMASEAIKNPDAGFDSEGLTNDNHEELNRMREDGADDKQIEAKKAEMRAENAKDYQEQQQRYAGLTQPEIEDVKALEAAGDDAGAQELANNYREEHAANDFANGVANEQVNENGLTDAQQETYESMGGDSSEEAKQYAKDCKANNEAKAVNELGLTGDQQKEYQRLGGEGHPEAEEYADQCRVENMANAAYESGGPLEMDHAKASSTSDAWQELANKYDENGLTSQQAQYVARQVKDGASEAEVAQMIDSFAQQNLGENYQEAREAMNAVADRGNAVSYGDINNADGDARTMTVGGVKRADGNVGYNIGTSQAIVDSSGNASTQSSSAAISVQESGGLTSYINEATGEVNTMIDPSSDAGIGSGNYAATRKAQIANKSTPGIVHGTGGAVTQLGSDNGVTYSAMESAVGTQVVATDANGQQSMVSGVEANTVLAKFGYQSSIGTTTTVASGDYAGYKIMETADGPKVYDTKGSTVSGVKAEQVISGSGYTVAHNPNLSRPSGNITTNINSGEYAGYSITETPQGSVVFDKANNRVSDATANKIISDVGYVNYTNSGTSIAQQAGAMRRSANTVNSNAGMVTRETVGAGNNNSEMIVRDIGNNGNAGVQYVNAGNSNNAGVQYVNTGNSSNAGIQYVNASNSNNAGVEYMNINAGNNDTIASTVKNSWNDAVNNRSQYENARFDPILNPNGVKDQYAPSYAEVRYGSRGDIVSGEEVKYREDSSNNFANIYAGTQMIKKTASSGKEVDPNNNLNNNPENQ